LLSVAVVVVPIKIFTVKMVVPVEEPALTAAADPEAPTVELGYSRQVQAVDLGEKVETLSDYRTATQPLVVVVQGAREAATRPQGEVTAALAFTTEINSLILSEKVVTLLAVVAVLAGILTEAGEMKGMASVVLAAVAMEDDVLGSETTPSLKMDSRTRAVAAVEMVMTGALPPCRVEVTEGLESY